VALRSISLALAANANPALKVLIATVAIANSNSLFVRIIFFVRIRFSFRHVGGGSAVVSALLRWHVILQ